MKKLLKFLIITIFSLFVLIFTFFQYLKSDLNNSFPKELLTYIETEIPKANPIDKEFQKVYDSMHPLINTNGMILERFKGKNKKECPCLSVAQLAPINYKNTITGNHYVLAYKIENHFTQEQCFNYYLNQMDFGYGITGVSNASKFYFNKDISQLNFKEKTTLVIMTENPFLYNPKRNPAPLNHRLEKLKN
ncbi:transglycosylase domain-containing protein [Mangrovimonas sp. TPBH4]|uniref:transglycosylase domain-containing protein n=1 Tax=Mangrovimonas sp. TPBH4 TaxID=1645914 RepID=UPI0006B4F1BF|nr:transglycosylase domain-containing protein [Mangrovimonas sp. TPBH4]